MESTVKAPDLLIYLRSSIPNLVGQIHKRGREYESTISIDYLSRLNERTHLRQRKNTYHRRG
jgi:deoxyadenosine/deoxycytidine kinase